MTPNQQLHYQSVLEGFNHGILIVTSENVLVYTNSQARKICQQLSRRKSGAASIPNLVWYACECLIKAQADYKGKRLIVTHRISAEQQVTIRITARWLEEHNILVILESSLAADPTVTAYGAAICSLVRVRKISHRLRRQLLAALTKFRHRKPLCKF